MSRFDDVRPSKLKTACAPVDLSWVRQPRNDGTRRSRAATPHAPTIRGAIAALATGLAACLLLAYPQGIATAAPDPNSLRAQAAALGTQINSLEIRAEIATERYNKVATELAGTVTELIQASVAVDNAQAASAETQAAATRRISAIYRGGGALTMYATVLDGTSPTDALDRIHTVGHLVAGDLGHSSQDAMSLTRAAETQARLGALASRRGNLERQAQDARNSVTQLLASRQQALASANRQLLQAVADQQASAQAAAEAVARTVIAGGTTTGSIDAGANPYAAVAIAAAKTKLGVPYVWGGTGPNGYDCSGLTQWAYRQAGLTLLRVAADQWRSGPEVAVTALAPGDLMFWATDPSRKSTIHHEAMYIGGGQMIEAPRTGLLVRQVPVRFGPDYAGAVRPTKR